MQTLPHIQEIIRNWPSKSRRLVNHLVDKYGLPHEATESRLIWRYNGPWKQTIVHRDGMPHNFPRPHLDILEQSIDYRVPPGKYRDVIELGGSILIDRTRGELTAGCDSEERNILMLNLAHDIAIGAKTVDQARAQCREQASIMRFGWIGNQEDLHVGAARISEREMDTADPDSRVSERTLVGAVRERELPPMYH